MGTWEPLEPSPAKQAKSCDEEGGKGQTDGQRACSHPLTADAAAAWGPEMALKFHSVPVGGSLRPAPRGGRKGRHGNKLMEPQELQGLGAVGTWPEQRDPQGRDGKSAGMAPTMAPARPACGNTGETCTYFGLLLIF